MKVTAEELEAIKRIRKGAKASGLSISKKEALDRLRMTRDLNDQNAAEAGLKRIKTIGGIAQFSRIETELTREK